jgi:hypothetical protein
MAARWFRRNASQRLADSGSLGARFIQREIVRSETSKPSMRSSPWMRGAPRLGSRRPSGRSTPALLLEISLQYKRKPDPCQRTTVSGVTTMRGCFQPGQTRRATTQKSLSTRPRIGRGRRRFSTVSCCRSARFRLRNARPSAPNQRKSRLNMARSCTRIADGYGSKLLILQSVRVLARDRPRNLIG